MEEDKDSPKIRLIARMLVVAYWLGNQKRGEIPANVSDMGAKGHDGLNWQLFMPLAEDLFKEIVKD